MDKEFPQLLLNRRSIRKYTDQKLDPEQVKLILQAALTAPSSKSVRPWQFVVVEDKDTIAKLKELKPQYATSLTNAPLAIVVCADTTKSDLWAEDSSIAAALMMLQTTALGLGSCWVEVHNRFRGDGEPSEEYVRTLLGIPEEMGVLCVVTVGYKDEARRTMDPEKLLWEKIHIGKW